MAELSIQLAISGFQELDKAFKGVRDNLDKVAGKAKSAADSLNKFGSNLQGIGTKLSLGITAPLVAIGGAAVAMSVKFNESMANIATLIPGSTERVVELKESVEAMAIATGKSTSDLAGGLFQVISSFGDSADSAKILGITARAATAGLATTEQALSLVSAVTKGYGEVNAATIQKAADLAFVTNKLGQTTFPELANSIGRVVPLAAELKVSQEELFGVMATATGVTGKAAEVSTQLRGVLQGFLAPTADMTELFNELGFETGKAALEQLGFQGALEAVVKGADDLLTSSDVFLIASKAF